MKKTFAFILSAIVIVSLFTACGKEEIVLEEQQTNSTVSKQEETDNQQEETSALAEIPANLTDGMNTPSCDTAFFEHALYIYGGTFGKDKNENDILVTEPVSLFFHEDWKDAKQLDGTSYYIWYMTMMWKEDLTDEERTEKYASPMGEDAGWFFPQEYFEPVVMQYFDITQEELRTTEIYLPEHEGYSLDVDGGIGETPQILIREVKSQDSVHEIHLTLKYEHEEKNKVLTINVIKDREFRFVSYISE